MGLDVEGRGRGDGGDHQSSGRDVEFRATIDAVADAEPLVPDLGDPVDDGVEAFQHSAALLGAGLVSAGALVVQPEGNVDPLGQVWEVQSGFLAAAVQAQDRLEDRLQQVFGCPDGQRRVVMHPEPDAGGVFIDVAEPECAGCGLEIVGGVLVRFLSAVELGVQRGFAFTKPTAQAEKVLDDREVGEDRSPAALLLTEDVGDDVEDVAVVVRVIPVQAAEQAAVVLDDGPGVGEDAQLDPVAPVELCLDRLGDGENDLVGG